MRAQLLLAPLIKVATLLKLPRVKYKMFYRTKTKNWSKLIKQKFIALKTVIEPGIFLWTDMLQAGFRAFKRGPNHSIWSMGCRAVGIESWHLPGIEPRSPEEQQFTIQTSEKIASNPKYLNIFLTANFAGFNFETTWPNLIYNTSLRSSDIFPHETLKKWTWQYL